MERRRPGPWPLIDAIDAGNSKKVRAFLEAGANPNLRTDRSQTPLHFAAARGDVISAKLLLRYGANTNVQSTSGDTPLHSAVRAAFYGSGSDRPDMVRLLLKNGADPNLRDDAGETPLHRACHHPKIAKVLVENGADIGVKANGGWTPLHFATWGGKPELVDFLLKKGGYKTKNRGRKARFVFANPQVRGIFQKYLKKYIGSSE